MGLTRVCCDRIGGLFAALAAIIALAFTTGASAATSERNVYYSYDVAGRQLTAMFDSASGGTHGEGITNSYDGFGELTSSRISQWDPLAAALLTEKLQSSYDAGGRRTQLIHPENSSTYTFTYAYDALSRLSDLCQGTGTCSSTSSSLLDGFTYGNNGLVSNRSEGSTGASTVSYSWDDIGRLTSQSDGFSGTASDVNWTLSYNPASQIATEARDNNSYAWTGAVNVNRNYAVNGLNQYTSAGSASFTYDANGNLTSDGTWTYTYDVENRLVKAVADSTTVNLTYDPLGRLFQVDKGTTGTTTKFVYDGDALALEYNSGGTVIDRYIHGSNAAADDPLVAYQGANLTNYGYLHADHLGSIIAVATSLGSKYAINTYDEYGIPGSGNYERFQYTGQAYIPELGLYYYKARFYSPTTGRFLQTDPIGYKDQINLYEYVGDDVVNRDDPTGLQEVPEEEEAEEGLEAENGARAEIRALQMQITKIDPDFRPDPRVSAPGAPPGEVEIGWTRDALRARQIVGFGGQDPAVGQNVTATAISGVLSESTYTGRSPGGFSQFTNSKSTAEAAFRSIVGNNYTLGRAGQLVGRPLNLGGGLTAQVTAYERSSTQRPGLSISIRGTPELGTRIPPVLNIKIDFKADNLSSGY